MDPRKKQYIFGCGTGRCGTDSLSVFLSLQRQIKVTHQHPDYAHDWDDNSDETFEKFCENLEKQPEPRPGDVAFYHLTYVERLLKRYPNSKFIIMRRWRENTVQSYSKLWRNHEGFIIKNRQTPLSERDKFWRAKYPKYDVDSKEKSIRLFHIYYYEQAVDLWIYYPNRILIFDLFDLNSREMLSYMLNWLQVPVNDRNVRPIRTNVSVGSDKIVNKNVEIV